MNKSIVLVALSLCSAGAAAEPASLPGEHAGWALQVTPYLWATGLTGNISPFRSGPTLDVNKSFSDVLHHLDIGGFANVWGRYQSYVFSGDVMYVDTTDGRAYGPLAAFQVPGLGVTIPPGASTAAKVGTKEFTTTLQAGYRVLDTPRITLDAMAGLRIWAISTKAKVSVSHPAIGTVYGSHGESFSWVDPVVGVRAFVSLTEKFSLQAQADVGGFGASSDVTWSALATLNYAATRTLSASAGYKALAVDYRRGGHVFDTTLSGPVLGISYRF